jgi:aminomethyltransferase
VIAGDARVGCVTSGTFSPTLQMPIAMAYVTRDVADAGTSVEVEIRGNRVPATVAALPFYRRDR